MNEQPFPPEHDRGAEAIDELISAALDGALDDAAAELGLTPTDARAAVEEHGDRHSALSTARDLLATPPPPLDEVTLRRLVSTAVAGAGPGDLSARRRRRATASIAGIAAAVLVVAGIGTLMLGGTDDSSDDAASGGATVADEMEALEPSADLGEVSDPSVLRDLLREAAPLPAPAAAEAQERVAGTSSELSAGDSTEDAPHSPTTGATGGDGDGSTRGLPETDEGRGDAAGDGIDCSTLLAADFEDVGAPLLLATATYDGEPAGVIVLSGDGGDLAVVYSQGDCTILATQTLTAP